jgi:glyoxylase-like metal-dependent hydrolase (beta-lactamase superfamily II)
MHMAEWCGNIAKISLPTPFPVGDVNVYVVKGEALTLIDAGVKTEAAWQRFTEELGSLRLKPEDIEQVVLTHHHPDHTGLVDFLPQAKVYGHTLCQRWLVRDESFLQEYRDFYRGLFEALSVPPELMGNLRRMEKTLDFAGNRPLDGTLAEGMEVDGLPGWFVIETPGHAQSHISLWNEKEGVLIGGDHILATISSNPMLEPPVSRGAERPKPQLQYNASLKKIKGYPVRLVFSGHGQEVRHVHALIDRRILRQHERAMHVKEMLEDRALTGFEICKNLFPQAYERELGLTMSETVGQLDYLQSIGAIRVEEGEKGEKYFRAAV